MPSNEQSPERKVAAPAVATAVAILEYLAHKSPRAGLTEISRALEINKSTCYNVLGTLVTCGLVFRPPNGTSYQLSSKLLELGTAVRRNFSPRARLRNHMTQLVEEFGVACVVAQILPNSAGYVIMDRVSSPTIVDDVAPPVGHAYALSAPAIGGAALSCMDEEEAVEVARSAAGNSDRFDEAAFRKRHALNKARGYAVSREEYRKGINAVATPIVWSGEPSLVLTLVGTTRALPTSVLDHVGMRLVEVAQTIEAENPEGHVT